MKHTAILLTTFAVFSAGAELQAQDETGAIYAMTNAAANSVAVFDRSPNGILQWKRDVLTGGAGTGAGLGSQGALTLSTDRRWLLAVNAGSNEVSVLSTSVPVRMVAKVPSGGTEPTSVTESDGVVYVLNAGGTANITGFWLSGNGTLTAIPNSTRPLSAASPSAPQIGFSFDGSTVVVTEKATNLIDIYALQPDGTVNGPILQPSHGQTPFGFQFDHRGHLIVSEAFGGAAGAGAVSSYALTNTDALRVISGSVPDFQGAPCWIVITKDGNWTYTTNNGTNSISGYSIGFYGVLKLVGSNPVTATTGNKPTDMALSKRNRYLYALNSADGTVSGYLVNAADGTLAPLGTFGHLPVSVTGLAGF